MNWNLGLRVLSTLDRSNLGRLVMSVEIWVSLNPWALKNESTKSAFSMVLRGAFLTTERADSWVRPHEFMRKESVGDGVLVGVELEKRDVGYVFGRRWKYVDGFLE